MNPYEILGLSPGASEKDIKATFKKLAKKHHPDVGGDEQKFKEINEAYSILMGKSKPEPQGPDFEMNDFFSQSIFDAIFRSGGAARMINRVHVDPELFIKGGGFDYIHQSIEHRDGRLHPTHRTIKIRVEPDTPVMSQIVIPGTEPNHVFIQLFPGNTQKYAVTDLVHLTEIKEIDVFQAMVGGSLDVTAPNGKDIKVKYQPGTQHGEIHRVRGLGLRLPDGRRGDYNIQVLVKIPAIVGSADEIKTKAAELLAEHIK